MDFSMLLKAIEGRHSCRKYQIKPVDAKTPEMLNDEFNSIVFPFSHDVTVVPYHGAKPDRSLFSVFVSPPDGAAFYGSTDISGQGKAGFVGEVYILLATSMGLATCWYGHYKSSELFKLAPVFPDEGTMKRESWMGYGYSKGEAVSGKRAICITPLGYADTPDLLQTVLHGNISKKRKPVRSLIDPHSPVQAIEGEMEEILYYASLAPSAMNSQFWRFSIGKDRRSITVAMPAGYMHLKWKHPNVDIGICASHIWITLMGRGYQPDLTIKEDGSRVIWQFTY
jgi:nitroreductase